MKKCFTICIIILFLLLVGCANAYQPGKSFAYVLPDKITSLDPQTAKGNSEQAIISMIFEGLCSLEEAGEAIGAAAKRWEANAENTRFTFYLRDNLCWVDGTPLTAADFVFGIRRSLDPATGATNIENLLLIQNAREVLNGEVGPDQLGVSAPDEKTVVFQLNTSFQDFPKLTAGARFMPCNQDYFENSGGHYGLESSYTLTNGPLTFTSIYSWNPEKSIELSKTDLYRGGREAKISKLTLQMPGAAGGTQDLRAALYQGSTDLLQITEAEVTQARERGSEIVTLNNSVLGLLLNTQNQYLKEIDLREIYMRTIDRQTVISRLTEGTQEALGIFPPSVKWNGKTFQELNDTAYPEKDSSVKNNIGRVLSQMELSRLPSITILCPDDDLSKNIATGIIIAWNDILPNAFNMEPLPYEDYLQRLNDGNYEAALYNISAGNFPTSVLQQFSSTASPQLLDSASFDSSLKHLTFDKTIFRQLEQDLMDQYVFYPIHYAHNFYAMSPKARRILVSPDTGADFTQALKKD